MTDTKRNVVSISDAAYGIWLFAKNRVEMYGDKIDKATQSPIAVFEEYFRKDMAIKYAAQWGRDRSDMHSFVCALKSGVDDPEKVASSDDPLLHQKFDDEPYDMRDRTVHTGRDDEGNICVWLVIGLDEDGCIGNETERFLMKKGADDFWLERWAHDRNQHLKALQAESDWSEKSSMRERLHRQAIYIDKCNYLIEPVDEVTLEVIREWVIKFGLASHHLKRLPAPLKEWEVKCSPDWNGCALHDDIAAQIV